MSEAIVVALITGGLALVGAVVTTVITSNTTLKKTETKPFRGMEAIMPSPSSGCCIR